MTPPPFERFFAVRRFQPTLAFAPDSASIYFSSNISGQFNLWRVPVRGGWPEQLTSYHDHTVRQIAVRRRDAAVVFSADHEGDEFHQLYLLEPDGWPQPLTDDPQVQHLLPSDAFSPDGTRVAYAANARKPTDMEVWVRDLDEDDPRAVFGEGMFAVPARWSPDGRQLLAIEVRTGSDQSIHLVDVERGTSRELTPHDEPARFEPGPWKPDGSGFFLLADAGAEFAGLAFYDLAARSWSYVEQPERDVLEVALSPDGRVLAWLENTDGWSTLRLRDLDTGDELPAPQLPRGTTFVFGSALTFSPDGRELALLWDQPRRTEEVFVVDVGSGEARCITDSRMGAPREDELIEPTLVSIAADDGHEIPAWLYRGTNDGPHPVVVYYHGGPEAQERPGYKPFMQYLCSRGIAVVAPNVRGSTGYGKSYQRLIYRGWGDVDLRDFETVADWVREQSWADAGAMGVCGGSYGGFATLTCLARLPQFWTVGVDAFGPSNLISLIETAPPTWWRFTQELIGDPDSDRERLLDCSPVTHVDQIRAPLLVVQGAKDPRVVPAESEQIVERLRELGRDVEYELFEDEGHGFTRHENEVRAWRMFAEFLERHLTAVRT